MAFNFKEVKSRFNRLKTELPVKIQNEGQRYYLNQFDNEQFDGIRWMPRVDRRNARKLLVRRGQLRRALAGSKREATWDRIRFQVSVQSKSGFDYAYIHNEGTIYIPRRKFLGRSRVLERKLKKVIEKDLKNCFR